MSFYKIKNKEIFSNTNQDINAQGFHLFCKLSNQLYKNCQIGKTIVLLTITTYNQLQHITNHYFFSDNTTWKEDNFEKINGVFAPYHNNKITTYRLLDDIIYLECLLQNLNIEVQNIYNKKEHVKTKQDQYDKIVEKLKLINGLLETKTKSGVSLPDTLITS